MQCNSATVEQWIVPHCNSAFVCCKTHPARMERDILMQCYSTIVHLCDCVAHKCNILRPSGEGYSMQCKSATVHNVLFGQYVFLPTG